MPNPLRCWLPLLLCALLLAPSLPAAPVARAAGLWYVDADASAPLQDGTSWASALADLQQALRLARAGDQVWVAEGVYRSGATGELEASFELVEGVALYGGFEGTETSLEERDPAAHPTILSGDLAGDDLSQEGVTLDAAQIVGQNARHVVSAVGLTAATALEGVIISGGDARGAPVARGGGLYAVNSSLMLREVALLGNAAGSGGGISVSGGQPLLEGVLLEGNLASGAGGGILALEGSVVELVGARLRQNRAADGGALASYASSPRIVNGALAGNQAARGGALYAYGGELQLLQATLAGNAGSTGSAAYLGGNASLGIGNSILWGNTPEEDPPLYIHSGTASVACTLLSGGYAGEGNLDADPLFVDLPGGELQLRPESPAVDAGDNGALPAGLEQDLAGGQRVRDGDFDGLARVDMGAYEYQALVPPVAGFDAEPLEGMVPLTVQLQDTSRGGITSWLWDLGDGSSSVERSPQHSYGEAGSYTVTLTVGGPGGTDSLQRAELIQVRPGSIAGQVRAWGSQAALPGVSLEAEGPGTVGASSTEEGGYRLEGLWRGSWRVTAGGGPAAGGAISAWDGALLLRHLAGEEALEGYAGLAADLDGDGALSAADARGILTQAVGLGPEPAWVYDPAEREYAGFEESLAGEDYIGILRGDVSGSWGVEPPAEPLPVVVLGVSTGAADPEGVATATVRLLASDSPFHSLSLQLRLPRGHTVTGVAPVGLAQDWLLAQDGGAGGLLRVALAGEQPLTGSGALLEIKLRRPAEQPAGWLRGAGAEVDEGRQRVCWLPLSPPHRLYLPISTR
ncbi:MAG: PKD domain-containing protein [Anaerolineae bacterium]